MSTLGNLIWVLCGGIVTAFLWALAGVAMVFTIIGIPWARACFLIAKFNLCPFGRDLINRKDLTGKSDIGTGAIGLIGNIVWFLFAGLWLAIAHIVAACVCGVTIIGIPFAIQHLKLAAVSMAPIGKEVVKSHIAKAAHMQNAQEKLAKIRGQ